MYRNEHLIDKTVEITIAKLSNSSITPNADNGKDVAKFMQEIYNKLNELNKNSNQFHLALADINFARAITLYGISSS